MSFLETIGKSLQTLFEAAPRRVHRLSTAGKSALEFSQNS